MGQKSVHTRSIAAVATTLCFLLTSIAFAALGPEDHQAVLKAVTRVFDIYGEIGRWTDCGGGSLP